MLTRRLRAQGRSFISPEAESALSGISELDYLSHIVFRLYERRGVRGGGEPLPAVRAPVADAVASAAAER